MGTTVISIPEAELNSGGRKMPLLGLGTAASPPVAPPETMRAVIDAIKLGYRHFDTAALYGSEAPLGEAIKVAISHGLIKSREELFVTSKLWCSDAHPGLVLPALRKSLQNLKMEYLDLYLIHWPVSSKPGAHEFPIKKEDFRAMDFKNVWEEMEDCQKKGLTRCIGVSNFSCKKISYILSTAKIPPAVNQVELNPLWQQQKLREFCRQHGIMLTAYAALGAKGTIWGSDRVMECEKLNDIASARGKTVAQVCLRWAYEQGISALVKSFNEERMKENLGIFDWELTDQESKEITEIPQSRGCLGEDYVSDHGPFRTIEELWDGEL